MKNQQFLIVGKRRHAPEKNMRSAGKGYGESTGKGLGRRRASCAPWGQRCRRGCESRDGIRAWRGGRKSGLVVALTVSLPVTSMRIPCVARGDRRLLVARRGIVSSLPTMRGKYVRPTRFFRYR